ncbi:ComEC/Rec2 family competence protein [Lichenihabitans psoromatis]|uniref:ComEC/Rec2 family competence protein n=1 Tax=Lichenihabitans psoromatis TaxID=2528642 RepID=UPI001038428A|nr:ComEC/Rec2 family competence protein [Lichenihabitans psoromatis]
MVEATRKASAIGVLAGLGAFAGSLRPITGVGRAVSMAFEIEWEQRRFFLWLPVLCGVGVLLFLAADRNPVLWWPMLLAAGFGTLAWVARNNRSAFMLSVAVAAVFSGFVAAGFRTERVAAPVLDRIRIAKLTGFVEEVDHRRKGSRLILNVRSAEGLDSARVPDRVRLTTRRDDPVEAGDFIAVTARLLPPAQASLPGGYAFARDAYFSGFGAVGSILGRLKTATAPAAPSFGLAFHMAVDRARNALASRVDTILGGDTGAIAAAMVTGKRDLLSEDGRDLIREAGIFHIITIAGVQMTLVAGLLFGGTRRGLALSRTLALRYPIKKWAALVAIAGAIAYDILTGSRIGTQRALFMTLIMLGAVLVDRRGFTMRNLALAALVVVLVEPESILGASFQLSFAAVAALVAVYETRERGRRADGADDVPKRGQPAPGVWRWLHHIVDHGRGLLVATVCATIATASFMAGNFHELSPYVFIGNPLTLAIIEFFAVPGALLGCVLYPLGLDGLVWHWVGAGIGIVLWAARLIASAPHSTVNLPAFAPWAMPFLALAVLSVVIWRTWLFRLTAMPLLMIGLAGTALGSRYDMIVAPTGDAVAVRQESGLLAVVGKSNSFAVEQWLRADGDGREAALLGRQTAAPVGRCDKLGCVAPLPGGQILSLVSEPQAFEEDCGRADVIVTGLYAPESCAAALIVDRASLASTGSLGLWLRNGGWLTDPARTAMTDRPWSPAPQPLRRRFRASTRPEPLPDRDGQGETDGNATPDDPNLSQP